MFLFDISDLSYIGSLGEGAVPGWVLMGKGPVGSINTKVFGVA